MGSLLFAGGEALVPDLDRLLDFGPSGDLPKPITCNIDWDDCFLVNR